MTILSKLLLIIMLTTPFPHHGSDIISNCRVEDFTLHTAFASVFANFPDRIDPSVDGYMASVDCSEMGEYRAVFFGRRWWVVRIADCLNPKDKARPGWAGDLDYRIFYYAEVPIAPTPGIICNFNPPLYPKQKLTDSGPSHIIHKHTNHIITIDTH